MSPTEPTVSHATLVDLAARSVDDSLAQLGAARTGLSAAEVARRRAQFGENRLAHQAPPTWYLHLWRAFANPFTAVLAVLAALSLATGDVRAAVVIGVIVSIGTGLKFVQEFRSTRAAVALAAMVRTHATVIRAAAAAAVELPIEDLVPGDIVHLSAGDMVPGDVRFIAAKDVFVSQAALTGEALPVEKEHDEPPHAPGGPAMLLTDLRSIGFMGTSLVSGAALAVVVATGSHTVFGSMAHDIETERPQTAFDRGVAKVSWLLIRFMLVMVPVVFLINGLSKGDWLQAFVFGLAVAVGLTPEMLPMIVTANLAKGAVMMARRKTIVKRINAIQNFGAMDVLCTDKTGTLTQDRIVLERHLDVDGADDARVLELAYVNSALQTGLKSLLDVAVLAHTDMRTRLQMDRDYQKVDEIPWDFVRKRMSVVVSRGDRAQTLVCKGAVGEMLALCTSVRRGGAVVPFDDATRQRAHALTDQMNGDGLRVVAVAAREFPVRTGPYTVADESALELVGFVGFLDPPKESAGPALAALAAQGVRVVVLTGDGDVVCAKVCRQVGLEVHGVALGPDLDPLDDAALTALAERTTVFARLSPQQKARVVQALQRGGHTVGFMGDGINDASALRVADVAISVDSAVDIAKESADIILLEKDLLVLHEGVLEGRRTFGNIMKYIKMTASSNFGNVLSVVVASVALPFLPMLPIQLLVQNLLYDISQTTIPFDTMDAEYLTVPRKWEANDIGRFMLCIGPISSLFDIVTFSVLWWVLRANTVASASLFQSGWFVEGLLSQTLIVHMIRTAKVPFIQSRAAWPVLALTGTIMLVGLALPFTVLGSHLALQPLPAVYFAWLAAILLGYAVITQGAKRWYIQRFGAWL